MARRINPLAKLGNSGDEFGRELRLGGRTDGRPKTKSELEKRPMAATRQVRSLALSLAFCMAAASASAQDAEKAFFAGKTVRIVVGSATGGGYDVYSRLIAPYLAKVLGATVIVE